MTIGQTIGLSAVASTRLIKRDVQGISCVVEYPKGSVRELKNDQGQTCYKVRMHADYGYIAKTKGRDGDEVDVLIGPLPKFRSVWVVHMKDMGPDKDQREDEDKVMLGFPSAEAAKSCFILHYPPNFFESMSEMPFALFRRKLAMAQLPHREKKIHCRVIN